jgi:hypothetical protein
MRNTFEAVVDPEVLRNVSHEPPLVPDEFVPEVLSSGSLDTAALDP